MAEELELNSTQVEHEYGASEIQVLEGLEAVRKRGPGGLLHRHHGDHQSREHHHCH